MLVTLAWFKAISLALSSPIYAFSLAVPLVFSSFKIKFNSLIDNEDNCSKVNKLLLAIICLIILTLPNEILYSLAKSVNSFSSLTVWLIIDKFSISIWFKISCLKVSALVLSLFSTDIKIELANSLM